MNVTCDKCSKRYSIADEKVRGKSVKIRCKQCQNLISVNGTVSPGSPGVASSPGAAGSSGAVAPMAGLDAGGAPAGGAWDEEESTRAMPALDNSASWFAMVKGTQIGPFDLVGLSQKVKSGEVSLRTYLWKQGMADWKRASDVPEVSPVFAGVSVGATATGPTSAAPAAKEAHLEAAAFRAARRGRRSAAPCSRNHARTLEGHERPRAGGSCRRTAASRRSASG